MFWLGRYAERAEDTARLLRAVGDRWADFHNSPEQSGAEALAVLLRALTEVTATGPGFLDIESETWFAGRADELVSLLVDADRPGTLAYAVRRLTDLSGDVREQLSTDTWMVLGGLERELQKLAKQSGNRRKLTASTPDVLARVLEGMLALSGLMSESLVRDVGWRFCEIGRRVERALHVNALLSSALGNQRSAATDSLVLESVLIAAESIITYRRRYTTRAGSSTVLDLLLADRENPRAIAYQLDRIGESLERIPADAERIAGARETLANLRDRVRTTDTLALAAPDADGNRSALREFLAGVDADLSGVAIDVERIFFVQPTPQRRLQGTVLATEAW